MLIVLAVIMFAAGWFVFVKNMHEGNSNWVLCLIMIFSPVLFHIIGLAYASYLHDQGQALGSAFLAFLLLLNSLFMLFVNILQTVNKKENTINS